MILVAFITVLLIVGYTAFLFSSDRVEEILVSRKEVKEGDIVTIACRKANVDSALSIEIRGHICGTEVGSLQYEGGKLISDNLLKKLSNASQRYFKDAYGENLELHFTFLNNETGMYKCRNTSTARFTTNRKVYNTLVVPYMLIQPIYNQSVGSTFINCTLPGQGLYGTVSITKDGSVVPYTKDPKFKNCSTNDKSVYLFSGKVNKHTYYCTLVPTKCKSYVIYSQNLTTESSKITTRPPSVYLSKTVSMQCMMETDCSVSVGWDIGYCLSLNLHSNICNLKYMFYISNVGPSRVITQQLGMYKIMVNTTSCVVKKMWVYLNLSIESRLNLIGSYMCMFSSGHNTDTNNIVVYPLFDVHKIRTNFSEGRPFTLYTCNVSTLYGGFSNKTIQYRDMYNITTRAVDSSNSPVSTQSSRAKYIICTLTTSLCGKFATMRFEIKNVQWLLSTTISPACTSTPTRKTTLRYIPTINANHSNYTPLYLSQSKSNGLWGLMILLVLFILLLILCIKYKHAVTECFRGTWIHFLSCTHVIGNFFRENFCNLFNQNTFSRSGFRRGTVTSVVEINTT